MKGIGHKRRTHHKMSIETDIEGIRFKNKAKVCKANASGLARRPCSQRCSKFYRRQEQNEHGGKHLSRKDTNLASFESGFRKEFSNSGKGLFGLTITRT